MGKYKYKVVWLGYREDLDYENTPIEEWESEIVHETDDLDKALYVAGLHNAPVLVAPHVHDWCFVDSPGVAPESYYTCGICAAHLTETRGADGLGREDFPRTTEWVEWSALWLPVEEEPEED